MIFEENETYKAREDLKLKLEVLKLAVESSRSNVFGGWIDPAKTLEIYSKYINALYASDTKGV